MSQNRDSNPVDRMTARLAEIEAETARHQQTLDKLSSEASEIKMALRVLRRYGANFAAASDSPPPAAPEGERRTMPAMILSVVAEHSFLDGATSKEIVEGIRKHWMPDVTPDRVRPTVWRMEKSGRLIKRGDRYDLPETAEGSEAKAAEPSETVSAGEAAPSPNESREGQLGFTD